MSTMDDGCPKLKEFIGMEKIHECMCKDWEAIQKIRNEANMRAAKAAAFKELVNTNMIASIASVGSEALEDGDSTTKLRPSLRGREQSVKVAEEVAKELLWRHMKGRPGFEKMLKESVVSSQDGKICHDDDYTMCSLTLVND